MNNKSLTALTYHTEDKTRRGLVTKKFGISVLVLTCVRASIRQVSQIAWK